MSVRAFPPTPEPWDATPALVRPSARDLWRGLRFYVPGWERGGLKPKDIVAGRVGDANEWGGDGGRLWTPDDERGHVITADNATTQDLGFRWAEFVPTHAVTCAILYRKTDTTARQTGAFGLSSTAGDQERCGAHLPYSDGRVYWDHGGTGSTQRVSYNWGADLGIDTDWHLWVFQHEAEPGYKAIWLDGIEKASSASGDNRTKSQNDELFYLFRHSNRAADLAQIGMFGMWNRILSAAEIEQLTADPHAPVRRTVQVQVAVFAGVEVLEDVTLTADPGTYTLTGQPTDLLRALILDGDPGAYALTGADADLLRSLLVEAEAGSYGLTGADAELLRDRILDAEAGTYSVTGADAALLRALLLTGEAGSYQLSGQAADLLRQLRVDADPGTYSLSGSDASLLRDLLLSADAGTYTLAGEAATLLTSALIVMSADPGSYSVSGQPADLLRDLTIEGEPGAYTVTGSAADLFRGITMLAEAGSYEVVGATAGLLLDRLMEAEAGLYELQGQDAGLLRDLLMDAEAGSYETVGEAADLLRHLLMEAEAGVITVTGQSADMLRDLIMTGEAGVYQVTGGDATLTFLVPTDAGPVYVVPSRNRSTDVDAQDDDFDVPRH